MEATMEQRCPICGCNVQPNPRYPRYVCRPCFQRTTDTEGKAVRFFQKGADGRLAASYVLSGEDYLAPECLVDGTPCVAAVAHFGGIVVQAR